MIQKFQPRFAQNVGVVDYHAIGWELFEEAVPLMQQLFKEDRAGMADSLINFAQTMRNARTIEQASSSLVLLSSVPAVFCACAASSASAGSASWAVSRRGVRRGRRLCDPFLLCPSGAPSPPVLGELAVFLSIAG